MKKKIIASIIFIGLLLTTSMVRVNAFNIDREVVFNLEVLRNGRGQFLWELFWI